MNVKPFLILQLRPETEASDDEFAAILRKGGLEPSDAHRIRLDCDPVPPGLDLNSYSGVIVGGGPGCVSDRPEDKTPTEQRIEDAIFGLMPEITSRDLPFLGCCYGIGILGVHLGGVVNKDQYGEPVGVTRCQKTAEGAKDPLVRDLPDAFDAFVGHKEAMQALPEGCLHLLASETCPFQMVRHGAHVYATQFHPEADSDGFALRIQIYQNRGYFPPEDAQALTDMCHRSDVHVPERILRSFVERYRGD